MLKSKARKTNKQTNKQTQKRLIGIFWQLVKKLLVWIKKFLREIVIGVIICIISLYIVSPEFRNWINETIEKFLKPEIGTVEFDDYYFNAGLMHLARKSFHEQIEQGIVSTEIYLKFALAFQWTLIDDSTLWAAKKGIDKCDSAEAPIVWNMLNSIKKRVEDGFDAGLSQLQLLDTSLWVDDYLYNYLVGEYSVQCDDFITAEEYFQRSNDISLNDSKHDFLPAVKGMLKLYRKNGNFNAIISIAEECISRYVNEKQEEHITGGLYLEIAHAYIITNTVAEGILYMEKQHSISRNNYHVDHALAILYVQGGDFKKATEQLSSSAGESGRDIVKRDGYNRLVDILPYIGQFDLIKQYADTLKNLYFKNTAEKYPIARTFGRIGLMFLIIEKIQFDQFLNNHFEQAKIHIVNGENSTDNKVLKIQMWMFGPEPDNSKHFIDRDLSEQHPWIGYFVDVRSSTDSLNILEATKAVDSILKLESTHNDVKTAVLYWLAESQFRKRDYESAINSLEKLQSLTALNQSNASIGIPWRAIYYPISYALKGDCYLALSEFEEAEKAYSFLVDSLWKDADEDIIDLISAKDNLAISREKALSSPLN
ncbi:hypothetical protein CEE37_09915 [candidate division LCP-89 bacterium B3_LCP]|uniref:Tetratricopeptide repeat protein n=1 Tax=candidate division LCP-89 bacterium B3_LCP TaxID=2012998 RepID=A0A532UYK1_UNCL8|nr:MAG: hypothetical protein CEE37_09915 [candidate division LCP-89 bacterium B3_LCP]